MRKEKGRSLLVMLAIIFIVMFVVNLTVLRICFDVRLSDLPPLILGDSSAGGVSLAEGDSSARGDSLAEGDSSAGGDSPAGGDSSAEGASRMLNKMSFVDKAHLGIILAKLNKSELQKIYDTIDDGVTDEEIHGIMEYVENVLDRADMEKLEDIFNRNIHLYTAIKE